LFPLFQEKTMSEEIKSEVPEAEASPSGAEASATASSSQSGAIREGASDAADAVARIIPAAGEYLSKGIYGVCYCAAYAVVFSALTVASVFSSESAAARGVHDGARDARKAVAREEHIIEAQPEGGVT
jgi:hypothetical protein